MAVLVLVHGGWAGGWQWREVANRLRAAGHEVFTPTLTGLGERVHLASPDVDLNTHIRDIVNVFLFEELWDVILVGTSYSGMVVTGVAQEIPERIAELVYLDAFVPADGQSMLDLIDPAIAAGLAETAQTEGDGWRVPHPPPVAPRRTPHPIKTATQPLAVKNPQAARIPRTFILCTRNVETLGPLSSPIHTCAARARHEGWRYMEMDSAHIPMETAPQELTDVLLSIAANAHPTKPA